MSYRVRDFLQDYRPLLFAAGAKIERAVPFKAAVEPQDSSRFRAAFNLMRQRGQLTDIQLVPTAVTPEEQIVVENTRAHSAVLAAAIPHVREALMNWNETKAAEYPFPGTYFGVCAILDFIYTGRIERRSDTDEGAANLLRNLLELLQVADQWDLPELKDEIGSVIDANCFLSRDTYNLILQSAKERAAVSLIKYCEDWGKENPESLPTP